MVLVRVFSVGLFSVELSTNQPTITHVAEGEGDKLMVKMEVTPDSSFPILEVVVDVIVEEGKEDKLLMKMMLEQDFLV